ncbi:hypothetical protein [Pasteuria penetrans]|uniref:hypothetical protein n=1 Tax=Pasteuria penetrans TaxID=86005 RepID=UPI0011EF9A54|nr:hypothetical protein [Pasteuria penetrans]
MTLCTIDNISGSAITLPALPTTTVILTSGHSYMGTFTGCNCDSESATVSVEILLNGEEARKFTTSATGNVSFPFSITVPSGSPGVLQFRNMGIKGINFLLILLP